MKRKVLAAGMLSAIGLCGRLWLGVYHHDEFIDSYLFIKHRPTFKWTFYSPRGQSDLYLEELSAAEQQEERHFEEFVRAHGMSR
ncbi:hypothetical protein [Nibribacter koreensis]|uniref:hypothetical protein n=1 Tax=Nibribacter koreensis TaxID=1084519 RepID=UPI0031F0E5F2